jgi:hypothetical protein
MFVDAPTLDMVLAPLLPCYSMSCIVRSTSPCAMMSAQSPSCDAHSCCEPDRSFQNGQGQVRTAGSLIQPVLNLPSLLSLIFRVYWVAGLDVQDWL